MVCIGLPVVEEKINTRKILFSDIFLVFRNDSVAYLLLMLENKSTKPIIAAQKVCSTRCWYFASIKKISIRTLN